MPNGAHADEPSVITIYLSNLCFPLPDGAFEPNTKSSSEPILRESQETCAGVVSELKKSGSFDATDLCSDDVRLKAVQGVTTRVENYLFSDDTLLTNTMADLERKLAAIKGDEDKLKQELNRMNGLLDANTHVSMQDLIKKLTEQRENAQLNDILAETVSYLYFIEHMRRYFNEKGVKDQNQQDRILYAMTQGLGAWHFMIPSVCTGFLQSVTKKAICINQEKLHLTLKVEEDGHVRLTARIPMVYRENPFDPNSEQHWGKVETSISVPPSKDQDIVIHKVAIRLDGLKEQEQELLNKKLEALHPIPYPVPPIVKEPQPLSEGALIAAHATPRTSMNTVLFGYQSVIQRAKGWFAQNWLPCTSGIAVVAGGAILTTALLTGGAGVLAAAMALGLGIAVTETVVALLAAGALLVVYGAMAAMSYAASRGEKSPSEKEKRSHSRSFTFEPPYKPKDKASDSAYSQELSVFPAASLDNGAIKPPSGYEPSNENDDEAPLLNAGI